MDSPLQQVVGKDEADQEDATLQCAIAASLSQKASALPDTETETEPEPEPEREQNAVRAAVKHQKTEQEGEKDCVDAGFVQVVMDTDE